MMKTTSVITLTAALSVILLGVSRFGNKEYQAEGTAINAKTFEIVPLSVENDIFMDLLTEHQQVAAVANTVSGTVAQKPVNSCDLVGIAGSDSICLDEVVFVENDEPVELGFDVNEYLPADFNPYQPANEELDLNSITFIEGDDFEGLGFDTAAYLPLGFDAYAGMEPRWEEIEFIEEEEPVVLGFDTRDYLPANFNAYALPELDLNDIPYIEGDETVELGFDVNEYLPANFDPYAVPEFDLSQINFIEDEDDSEIWNSIQVPSDQTAINF